MDELKTIPVPQQEPTSNAIPAGDPFGPAVTGSPDLPQAEASQRAAKAAWSIGAAPAEVEQQIRNGGENDLRQAVSASWNQKSTQMLQQKIYEAAGAGGYPRDVTNDQINQMVQDTYRDRQFNDPKSIFEWANTQKYFNNLYGQAQTNKGNWYDDFIRINPDAEKVVSNLGKSYITNLQYLQTKKEDVQSALKEQSTMQWAWQNTMDFILGGLPESYMMRGNVPGVGFFSGFEGANVEEQRKALQRMEPPEFRDTIDKAIQYMVDQKQNPSVALNWIERLIGGGDDFKDHLGTVLDVAGLASVVPVARIGNMFSKMAAAAVSKAPQAIVANAAIGNIKGAASASATRAIKGSPIEAQVDRLYDGFNAAKERLANEPNNNFRELSNRQVDEYNAQVFKIANALKTSIRVDQTADMLATPEGQDVIRGLIENKYGRERILNIGDAIVDPSTNTHWIDVQLGTPNALYWDTGEQALTEANRIGLQLKPTNEVQQVLEDRLKNVEYRLRAARAQYGSSVNQSLLGATGRQFAAKRIDALEKEWGATANKFFDIMQNETGAEIRNDGLGFYIRKWESVNKDAKTSRDLFISTPDAQSPKGSISDYISALRTPGETFSKNLFDQARVMTYGPAIFRELAKSDLEAVNQLRGLPFTKKRQEYNQLEEVMRGTQTFRDSDTGELGAVPNISELHQIYLQNFERVPSEREVAAFYSWKRYEELARSMETMNRFSVEANMGAEQHRLVTQNAKGEMQYSPWVIGVEKKGKDNKFPNSNGESVLVSGLGGFRGGLGQVIRPSHRFSGRVGAYLDDAVQKGNLRSIKLLYPHEKPLANYGVVRDDHMISHMVGRIESKPLEMRPNVFRPWEYDAPFSLKQAVVRTDPSSEISYMLGDRTFAHAFTQHEGRDMEFKLNAVRKLIAEGNEAAARVYAQNNLPVPWEKISNWFESGMLTSKEDIRLVPKGQRVVDLDNALKNKINAGDGKYKDGTLTPLFRNKPDPYEIYTMQNAGTKNNPLWEHEPAPRISPMTAINRSFQGLVQSTYMNDFKRSAIDQWIADARAHLQVRTQDEIDHSPYHFFYNGIVSGTSPDVYSRLEGNRYKIKQLLGTPGPLDTWLHKLGQDLADMSYEGGAKRLLIAPAWLIPKIPDAGAALRSLAYHAVFSWNPVQIMVQSMNYATIGGLAGFKLAAQGSAAGFLHNLSRMNNNWVPGFDKMLSKFGWKPGQFTEAQQALQATGLKFIGKEHMMNEGLYRMPLISGKGQTFLDFSSFFYNGAERNQRFAGWYTAWKEFADANGGVGPKTNHELGSVLGRADTLTGEMTSASKSVMQKGPLAFTAQFQGYSMRMLELLWGHRITPAAKYRTLMTYGALFGVPVSASMVGGLSWVADTMKDKTKELTGYIPGEHWYSTMLNEGIPAYLLKVSGLGYVPNIGKRYASMGIDLDTDKDFLTVAGGAAHGILSTALSQSDPLIQSMMSFIRGDGKAYPPTTNDLIDAMKTWGAFGKGAQLYTALTTHEWRSRNGQNLKGDIGALDAFFMTLTGLQDERVSSLHDERMLADAKVKIEKAVENRIRHEYRRWSDASLNNDRQQMERSMSKIQSMLITSGYPPENLHKLFGMGISSVREPAITRAERERATKNVPVQERPAVQERFMRQLQLENK